MKHYYYAKVTSKGQVTIPKPVRETLDIDSGDSLLFTIENGQVTGIDGVRSNIEDLFGKFTPMAGADTPHLEEIRQQAWNEVVAERIRRMNEW